MEVLRRGWKLSLELRILFASSKIGMRDDGCFLVKRRLHFRRRRVSRELFIEDYLEVTNEMERRYGKVPRCPSSGVRIEIQTNRVDGYRDTVPSDGY